MTVVKCLNEETASNIVIEIVQFLRSLHVALVDYLHTTELKRRLLAQLTLLGEG